MLSKLPRTEVRAAEMSRDLHQMVPALEIATDPIDRHFLLMAIVEEAYRRRREPEAAELCANVAEMHVNEFSKLVPALKRYTGQVPEVPTFQIYSQLLADRGEYDKAVWVCEQALEYEVGDRTKTGYRGRVERIRKKQAKAGQR